MRSIY